MIVTPRVDSGGRVTAVVNFFGFRNSSGSLAIFAAIRRAASFVLWDDETYGRAVNYET
jgi:hypothetical protein